MYASNRGSSWLGANKSGRQRFSLLLLDEREYYFQDHHAIYYLPRPNQNGISIQRRRATEVPGRLKICSVSLVFDPESARYPVTRFLYENIKKIKRLGNTAQFYLQTSGVVEMMESNFNHPYNFREIDDYDDSGGLFVFSFTYSRIETVLQFVVNLWEAANISNKEIRLSRLDLAISRSQKDIQFDTSRFADIRETPQLDNAIVAQMITPLVETPGCIMITNSLFYFQPFNDISADPVFRYYIRDMNSVYKRRYLMSHSGLELLFSDERSLFLKFETKLIRDKVYDVLMNQEELRLNAEYSLEQMQVKWSNGTVSNFEYLMFLNQLGGRSLNDLTQYPVFPWVIADYESRTLDLKDSKTFRDLSKPIGALNPIRLEAFRTRFAQMPSTPECPRFLYGSHYSTPGYVLYFLVRVAPEYILKLQSGKFDAPDRLFSSIERCWASVLKSQADVKELIPEFYGGGCTGRGGNFLLNEQTLDLGIKQDGSEVGDVELPPWAIDNEDFIGKCREALESEYVSENIHKWIDLIFGFKQTGEQAIEADNLFYWLTYEGAVDVDTVDDPVQRNAFRNQIREFGQTPHQLFKKKHPKRGEVSISRRKSKPPPPPISSSSSLVTFDDLKSSDEFVRMKKGRKKRPSKSGRRHKNDASSSSSSSHHRRHSSKDSSSHHYKRTNSSRSENSALPHSSSHREKREKRHSKSSSSRRKHHHHHESDDSLKSSLHVSNSDPRLASHSSSSSSSSPHDVLSQSSSSLRVSSAPVTPVREHGKEVTDSPNTGTKRSAKNRAKNGVEQKHDVLDGLWEYQLDAPTVPENSILDAMQEIDIQPLPQDLNCEPLKVSMDVAQTTKSVSDMSSPRLYIGRPPSDRPDWGHLSSVAFKSDTLNFHRSAITALSLSANGEMLYSGDADSMLAIYSLKKKKLHRSTSINGGMAISSICASADDKNVVIGSYDNCIYVYSIDFARVAQPIHAHDSAVSSLDLHDMKLLSGSWDSTVKLWQFRESQLSKVPVVEFAEHEAEVKCLSVSYNGYLAASGSEYGVLILWDLRQKCPIRIIDGAHEDEITDVQWSPTDRSVFSCSGDGFVKQFDPSTGSPISAFHANESLTSLKTDGTLILTSGELGDVRLWDAQTQKELCQYSGQTPDPISCFVVANDGRLFVTGQSVDHSNNLCVFKS